MELHTPKQNDIEVETRALIDLIEPVETSLLDMGAELVGEVSLTDHHYADLASVDPDKHTYEQTGKAARIRFVINDIDGGDKNRVEVVVRKVIPEFENTREMHDSTSIDFFEIHPEEAKLEELESKLAEMGFPHALTKITKTRKTYKLDDTYVYLENIEGFGPAIEIKNFLDSPVNIKETKQQQQKLLEQLKIPESEIIRTSHTHMIIDSRIKRDPKIKIPALEKELKDLEEKKKGLLALTHDYAVNEGDGWHDNAALDKLYEDVSVVTIRIRNLKKAIFETKKEGAS